MKNNSKNCWKNLDLSGYKNPPGYRGRNDFLIALWWIVQLTVFKNSPRPFYGFRVFLLRLFGAKIGQAVRIRPTAKIEFPWKLSIGDNSWVGEEVVLYSLSHISIGDNSVISQRCYISTGSHDHSSATFELTLKPVSIGSKCWIGMDTYIADGIEIGDGTIVGARSSVFGNLPGNVICYGSPCKVVRVRE